ncbi:dihydrofolate reductase-like [Limulus polyphemus]|uniref:dihydrofolate reductase n=1 Tax=Limulus polyphemus TaxID=6850 RepID=A0ABM1BDN7_LIMPO|nr:dihydrofolate reductase-like [Limulus polyphemus]
MSFFKCLTLTTKDKEKQNAVVMGRKTWFSIPEKHRPLAGRINIVLSRELKELPGAHHLVPSFQEVVQLLKEPSLVKKIEKIFVIGGSSLYKEAIDSSYCSKIYLTRIDHDFQCDAFFPELDTNKYLLIRDAEVLQEEQEENGIKYRYEVYKRHAQL